MGLGKHWTPTYLVARGRTALYRRRNHPVPLLALPAIDFLQGWIRSTDCLLEYGSGHSTRWYADRAGSVTSIENMAEWHKVVSDATHNLSNVQLHLFDGPGGQPEPGSGGYGAHSDDPCTGPQVDPAYVHFIDTLPDCSVDIVVNDGWARHQVAVRASRVMRPGGLLVWDDVDLRELEASPTPEIRQFLDEARNWRHVCWYDGVHKTTAFFVTT